LGLVAALRPYLVGAGKSVSLVRHSLGMTGSSLSSHYQFPLTGRHGGTAMDGLARHGSVKVDSEGVHAKQHRTTPTTNHDGTGWVRTLCNVRGLMPLKTMNHHS